MLKVLLVEVGELVERDDDVTLAELEGEPVDHILERHEVGLATLLAPPEQDGKVEQSLGRDLVVLVPGHVDALVTLAQLLALFVDEEADVSKFGWFPAECVV